MSTRANIVLKDNYGSKLWFYRHSDGYPDGTMPTLTKFVEWLSTSIRNNISQGSGWLIILGAIEYNTLPKFTLDKDGDPDLETIEPPKDWKVGAYEPTTGEHGDIDYLYEINLDTKEITIKRVDKHYPDGKFEYKDIKTTYTEVKYKPKINS